MMNYRHCCVLTTKKTNSVLLLSCCLAVVASLVDSFSVFSRETNQQQQQQRQHQLPVSALEVMLNGDEDATSSASSPLTTMSVGDEPPMRSSFAESKSLVNFNDDHDDDDNYYRSSFEPSASTVPNDAAASVAAAIAQVFGKAAKSWNCDVACGIAPELCGACFMYGREVLDATNSRDDAATAHHKRSPHPMSIYRNARLPLKLQQHSPKSSKQQPQRSLSSSASHPKSTLKFNNNNNINSDKTLDAALALAALKSGSFLPLNKNMEQHQRATAVLPAKNNAAALASLLFGQRFGSFLPLDNMQLLYAAPPAVAYDFANNNNSL